MPPCRALGHSWPESRELSGRAGGKQDWDGMNGKMEEAMGRTRTPRSSNHAGFKTDGERSSLRSGEPPGSGLGP